MADIGEGEEESLYSQMIADGNRLPQTDKLNPADWMDESRNPEETRKALFGLLADDVVTDLVRAARNRSEGEAAEKEFVSPEETLDESLRVFSDLGLETNAEEARPIVAREIKETLLAVTDLDPAISKVDRRTHEDMLRISQDWGAEYDPEELEKVKAYGARVPEKVKVDTANPGPKTTSAFEVDNTLWGLAQGWQQIDDGQENGLRVVVSPKLGHKYVLGEERGQIEEYEEYLRRTQDKN